MKRSAPVDAAVIPTLYIPWQGVGVADLQWCGLDGSRFPLPPGTIVFDAGGPWDVPRDEDCQERRVWIRAVGVVVKSYTDASDVLILSCTRRPPYKAGTVCRIDAD